MGQIINICHSVVESLDGDCSNDSTPTQYELRRI